MWKKAIMAVLCSGILSFVVTSNTYAAEKRLDLSKPENLARLKGTWKGTWRTMGASVSVRGGDITWVFAYDPKDEEKPLGRKQNLLGSTRSDPKRFSTSRGKVEYGRLVFVVPNQTLKDTIDVYERDDGTLILRSETHGSVNRQGYQRDAELVKVSDADLSLPPVAAR